MITLPLLVYQIIFHYDYMPFFYAFYPIILIVNMLVHAEIDNEKANKKKINLITDQIGHLIQIILTYFYFLLYTQNI